MQIDIPNESAYPLITNSGVGIDVGAQLAVVVARVFVAELEVDDVDMTVGRPDHAVGSYGLARRKLNGTLTVGLFESREPSVAFNRRKRFGKNALSIIALRSGEGTSSHDIADGTVKVADGVCIGENIVHYVATLSARIGSVGIDAGVIEQIVAQVDAVYRHCDGLSGFESFAWLLLVGFSRSRLAPRFENVGAPKLEKGGGNHFAGRGCGKSRIIVDRCRLRLLFFFGSVVGYNQFVNGSRKGNIKNIELVEHLLAMALFVFRGVEGVAHCRHRTSEDERRDDGIGDSTHGLWRKPFAITELNHRPVDKWNVDTLKLQTF